MVLTLSDENTDIIKWYVSEVFSVHPEFVTHTLMTTKMGNVEVISISKKKHLMQ